MEDGDLFEPFLPLSQWERPQTARGSRFGATRQGRRAISARRSRHMAMDHARGLDVTTSPMFFAERRVSRISP